MRATEIIRGVIDLIDKVECGQVQQSAPATMSMTPLLPGFAEIFAQLSHQVAQEPESSTAMYDNSPDPLVKDIHSVTTAAGLSDVKHPHDLRGKDQPLFPAVKLESKDRK